MHLAAVIVNDKFNVTSFHFYKEIYKCILKVTMSISNNQQQQQQNNNTQFENLFLNGTAVIWHIMK